MAEASKTTGQIEEFIMKYNGEGIQHTALLADDLLASLDGLRKGGFRCIYGLCTQPTDSRLANRRPESLFQGNVRLY